ncbi:MAG: PEP-CTERM sorting domain-containing protein [Desulfuromonadaceae bacterium]|jgi:hypothetical protein
MATTVTGNALALITNDQTQELTFTFLSPVAAFGFNFGGTELEWQLQAYSVAGSLLDELTIPVFGSSNDGEWFGIAAAGIAWARLYNPAFDVASNTGSLDYVVLDNFTYASAVPEPSTFMLIALGLAGLALRFRHQRSNRAGKEAVMKSVVAILVVLITAVGFVPQASAVALSTTNPEYSVVVSTTQTGINQWRFDYTVTNHEDTGLNYWLDGWNYYGFSQGFAGFHIEIPQNAVVYPRPNLMRINPFGGHNGPIIA